MIVSNLLFVLFSLPVVTTGASLSALDYTLMKLQRGDRTFKVAATFWKGFRECFAKATICFLTLAALLMTQLLEISWCRQFQGPVSLFRYALAGLMVLEVILAMYLFPVIAAFNGGIGELLKNALYFAFSKPFRMMICLVLNAFPLFVTYTYIKYLPLWAFLWLIVGFATVRYGSARIMLTQFIPFLPEVDICGDIILPGSEGDPSILMGEERSAGDADEETLREMMKFGL